MADKWDKFIVSDPAAAPATAVDKWEKFAVSTAPAAAPDPTALANQALAQNPRSAGLRVGGPISPAATTRATLPQNVADQNDFGGRVMSGVLSNFATMGQNLTTPPLSKAPVDLRNMKSLIAGSPRYGQFANQTAMDAVNAALPIQELRQGDYAGAASKVVTNEILRRGAGAVGATASDLIQDRPAPLPNRPVQAAVVPEAAHLPSTAIDGAERIFRAAAPVGSDPMFRKSLYTAAGDLAEIGRKVEISEARGGVIKPDMRVRATVGAINDHLSEMYNSERAPQIQRNAQAPVVTKFGPDATEALQNIAKNGSDSTTRALASRALSEPALPLAQVDELARVVNRETAPMRGLTSQELAQMEGGSRKLAAAKALDGELSDKIATELGNRGEAGIKQYEKRYGALSSVRDQLQGRMNMAELQRRTPVSIARDIVGGARNPMAGASQAATANVSIGRQLQVGLRKLAVSGVKPERPVGAGAPPLKGLLGTGAIQLGSEMEPLGQPSAPPAAQSMSPQSRLAAQRSLQQALAKLPVRSSGTVKITR